MATISYATFQAESVSLTPDQVLRADVATRRVMARTKDPDTSIPMANRALTGEEVRRMLGLDRMGEIAHDLPKLRPDREKI